MTRKGAGRSLDQKERQLQVLKSAMQLGSDPEYDHVIPHIRVIIPNPYQGHALVY